MKVDQAPAGPVMDAAVAEALGLDVVGFLRCDRDPESGRQTMPWADSEFYSIGIRPVFVDDCVCEFKQDDDKIFFKHTKYCLKPVPRYSEDIDKAWEIVNAAIDGGWEIDEYANWDAYLPEKSVDEPEWYWAVSFVHWADEDSIYAAAEADTASLAICRAFLKAHGVVEIGWVGQ